jgi:hypothetical protein
MSPLETLQAKLSIVMGEIDDICAEHNYDVMPTLILRHTDGPSKSLFMSNDSIGNIVSCITELENDGVLSDQSPHEAVLKLLADNGF